jgi:hypothetical protein
MSHERNASEMYGAEVPASNYDSVNHVVKAIKIGTVAHTPKWHNVGVIWRHHAVMVGNTVRHDGDREHEC